MYIYVHVQLMGTVDMWDYLLLWMEGKVPGGMQGLQGPCTCTYMHMVEDHETSQLILKVVIDLQKKHKHPIVSSKSAV